MQGIADRTCIDVSVCAKPTFASPPANGAGNFSVGMVPTQVTADSLHDVSENKRYGDVCFLELVDESCGLFDAIVARNMPVAGKYDVCSDNHFKLLKSLLRESQVRWLHLIPPKSTFTRSRANCVRSDLHPNGVQPVSDAVVRENSLSQRLARLARVQLRSGGVFTVEHPARSYLWRLPFFASLQRLPNVTLEYGDQYIGGTMHRLPTGWLSNSTFLRCILHTCPGGPGHRHAPFG